MLLDVAKGSLFLLSLFLLSGCLGAHPDDPARAQRRAAGSIHLTGDTCQTMDDCVTKLCLTLSPPRPTQHRVCTDSCTTAANCRAGWGCIVTTSLARVVEGYCVPPPGFVAVDGGLP
ncbi:MAG: hypothetical protein USCGTAYLOR_01119 [Chromatiales bacterium USCg_Taylor]|nr:MAG: hypothetical protein USCGTAYLOR_01119 [Chromatiales bacterium USCg_Taylor]